MIGTRAFVLSIGLVNVLFNYVLALDASEKEAIINKALPFVAECIKKHPVADESLKSFLESGKFSALNNCFTACVLKGFGVLNEKGMLDVEKSLEAAKEHFSSEDFKTVPDTLNKCKSVNDKQVSDGDMGCERVHHLVECASPFIESLFPKK